jgi:type VI secretion system protein ImpM
MCFGKLSNYGDFIKHNSAGAAVRLFDQWIQEGMYLAQKHYHQDWQQTYQTSSAYQFLFYPQEAGQFLAGILWPSQDKSGRQFPFVVSAKLEKTDLDQGIILLAPLLFAPYFRQILTFLDGLSEDSDFRLIVPTIESIIKNISLDFQAVQGIFEDYLATTKQEEFWSSIFGHFNDPRKFLVLDNLAKCIFPLRTQTGSRSSLGLRFPLGSKVEERNANICFWIKICSWANGRRDIEPVYFWSDQASARQNFLYLFLQKPPPKFFLYLIRPDDEYEGLCLLEEEGLKDMAQTYERLPRNFRLALESKELALKNLYSELFA